MAAALSTYRRRFWRVVLAAVVIMVPVDLVVSILQEAARLPEGGSAVAWGARVGAVAANAAAATLGTTFFAGMLDRVVAVDQHGREDARLWRVLRDLPVGRLILVDLAAVGLIVLGLVAFVLPGLVLAVLLGVVGPVLVIEDLRVWQALKRSVVLVLPHFLLVLLLVFVPTSLEESLVEWAEHGTHGDVALWLVIDVALTAVVGSFVGMLEITLAHGLIADHSRRLATRDAAEATAVDAAGPAVPLPDAAGPAHKGPTAPGGGGAAG